MYTLPLSKRGSGIELFLHLLFVNCLQVQNKPYAKVSYSGVVYLIQENSLRLKERELIQIMVESVCLTLNSIQSLFKYCLFWGIPSVLTTAQLYSVVIFI